MSKLIFVEYRCMSETVQRIIFGGEVNQETDFFMQDTKKIFNT